MVAGSRTPNSRAPARILMVCAVLMLGSLAPAIGTVTAQAGTTTIKVGPFFEDSSSLTFPKCPGSTTAPYIRAQPDYGKTDQGVWQTRQIQVITAVQLTEVDFDYSVVAPPGTANKPGAPQMVEWGDQSHGSKAAGWNTVVVANSQSAGATNRLSFLGGTLSPTPNGQIFTVAFRLLDNAIGDSFAQVGTGKVSATAGSKDIFGSGTTFTGFFQPGDIIRVAGDAHQYAVASVQGPSQITGSAGAGSDTSHLKDASKNFTAIGVPTGAKLTITTGPAAGSYTVVSAAGTSLAFSPAAPGAPYSAATQSSPEQSGAYTIAIPDHVKLVDKFVGSSLAPPTGLTFWKIDQATFPFANQMSFPVKVNDAAFCIIVDNTLPKLVKATTRDTDFNGLIDEIVLQFNEEMDPATLDPAAFLVNASNSGEPIPYSVLPLKSGSLIAGTGSDDGHYACLGGLAGPFSECINQEKTVKLKLAEGYRYDTGLTPEVTYPRPGTIATFTDLAHNPLGNVTPGDVTEVDGAKPVLVSVFDYEGATSILATFSEPVIGTGAGAAVQTSDFVYYDSCYRSNSPNPPCSPNPPPSSNMYSKTENCITASAGVSPEIGAAIHTPGASGNTVVLPIIAVATDPGCKVFGVEAVRGKVGLGDAHPTLGDVVALNTISSPPPDSKSCPGIDFFPCESLVRDAAGLTGVPTFCNEPANFCDTTQTPNGAPPGPVVHGKRSSLPMVVDAVVNIDTFQVTLNFNGPVSDASGNANPLTLNDVYVIAADGTGQGPGGITQILHRAGSARAILTLDRKARPTDVDETPAKIGIACNRIKGTNQAAFVPCADPDGTGGAGVALVDNVNPSILHAETIDSDRNGQVDGVFLEFTEPIDDSTFCQQGANPPPTVCQSGQGLDLEIKPWDSAGATKYLFDTDVGPVDRCHWDHSCTGIGDVGLRVDTGNGLANDRFGIIKFSGPIIPQPAGLGTSLPSDAGFETGQSGLFSDLSHPAPASPPYATARHFDKICNPNSGNIGCLSQVTLTDGAPPVLLLAQTVDTPPPIAKGSTTPDLEGDGYLDGYRLTFSEPILDHSFCHDNSKTGPDYQCPGTKEWAVAGHNVTGMRTRELNAPTGSGNDDNVIILNFTRGKQPDTGDRPELTYVGPEVAAHGLKDTNGVQMLPIKPIDGFEQDDAPPVIASIDGFVGRNNVTVHFSEPVDNGNKGNLVRSNFQYYNIDHQADGVSGLQDQDSVAHKANTDTAVMHLNCPTVTSGTTTDGTETTLVDSKADFVAAGVKSGATLGLVVGGAVQVRSVATVQSATVLQIVKGQAVAAQTPYTIGSAGSTCGGTGLLRHDLANDTISAELNSIYEVSPTVAVKKAVSIKTHNLGNAIDVFRPDNVTGMQVVSQLTSANSITLTWVAPGNDGNGFGAVSGYRIKVSTQKISPADFNVSAAFGTVGFADSNATTKAHADGSPIVVLLQGNKIYATLAPDSSALAGPGQFQKLTVIGLDSQTTYHFAVEAFDGATFRCGAKVDNSRTNFTAVQAACALGGKTVVPFTHYSGMRPLDVPIASPNYDVTGTTGKDLTPPAPQPVIASTTHPANRASPKMTAIFSWTNATDNESHVSYHFALNTDPQYQVLVTDLLYTGAAGLPSVSVPIPSTGTWYFHVAAFSGGGNTATAHYTIIVGQSTILATEIEKANSYVVADALRSGDHVTVTWQLPVEALLPPGSIFQGIQVWRIEGCGGATGCTLVRAYQTNGTYDALHAGTWVDNSTGASSASGYRVDMVFLQDQTETAAGQSHTINGFSAVATTPGPDNSALWWLLAAGALLLVAALVVFLVIRNNRAKASAAAFEEIPQETLAAGIDPATGLPAHDVRCPSCQTAFQALGKLPLQITCPNCGVSGLLQ